MGGSVRMFRTAKPVGIMPEEPNRMVSQDMLPSGSNCCNNLSLMLPWRLSCGFESRLGSDLSNMVKGRPRSPTCSFPSFI